jgi:hypothetical protein
MYSVMRVNTLSPEGVTPVHWSTPDRTPHKAMWLWDSCFHAIGRSVQDPELAWEFVAAMLHAQGGDGHVPGGLSPWSAPPSPPPPPTSPSKATSNPPLLALATWFVHSYGGVNASSLGWALPRLERYVDWFTENRRWHNSSLLLAWANNDESGLDNSPLWKGGAYCPFFSSALSFCVWGCAQLTRPLPAQESWAMHPPQGWHPQTCQAMPL